jgi:uncharacterized protein YhaN
MRLRRIDLTRFGKFTDHSLDFGAAAEGTPDLHIIYGLNEAGKSTTFAAYLDLLYGIPERSPYNYLHPYNTMQIGARLEFDGTEHELVRLKQRSGSLLDERGQPVNEAMLTSALGGITRDAYRTMFSLDDQSLKDGGNAIIQSKGELGELLFSASTGLAGLSRSLVAAAEEASGIYKKRSSSTQLAELKRMLVSLKAERDEIDTFAAAYAALTSTHIHAETAYSTAMRELAETSTRNAELTRILGALPLAGELARLSAELAELGDLPRPPSEWFALLPQLSRDETRLQALLESADRNIGQLTSEFDEIGVDDRVLALASRIQSLDESRARYRTAENDLPKRRIAVVEQDTILSGILEELEQEGHSHPQALLPPASVTGILRDLIETRSGVEADRISVDRELDRVKDNLERVRSEGKREFEEASRLTPETLSRVEAALAKLNGTDLQAQLTVELRNRDRMKRDCESQFAQLAPWSGDADTLRQLRSAEPRQIEVWRGQAAAIDKRIDDHRGKVRDLVTEQRQTTTRLNSLQAEGPIDDGEARALRGNRDSAWQTHIGRLDLESAKTFEDSMRRDDALSTRRLLHAQELAELRHLNQRLAANAEAIIRQEELLSEAMAESAVLAEKIRAFIPADIDAGAEISALLPALESWTSRRADALAAFDTLQQAESGVTLLKSDLARHEASLASALRQAGMADVDDREVGELGVAAANLVAQNKSQATMRASHEKVLADLNRDLFERERAYNDATAAADAWQQQWQNALASTWFSDKAGSVPAVREILKVLSALPGVLREREQMSQRVATMERDQEIFRTELSNILTDLGDPIRGADALASADMLLERYGAALRAQQIHADRSAVLNRLIDGRRALEEQLAIHNASKAELTAFFDTDTLAAVSLHLEQARERERLEKRIAELRQQIIASLRTATYAEAEILLSGIDVEDIERQSIELSARIEDITERTRLLYADMTRAKDKLDAVGGDDAVARIEARRRTVFLEIEDLAIRYLKLRAGTYAAEQALHLYREKHRSSMMTRASEAFRLITGGSYSGLAARPDKDKEILIGVSRDGSSKLADHMSTGTQFQLYLALRLAGYEEFAAVRPSVPFIADDIMESFDNPRSEEVFRLLGEMAGVGQVIYLTHHWHLCEIARNVVPGVKIHQLG